MRVKKDSAMSNINHPATLTMVSAATSELKTPLPSITLTLPALPLLPGTSNKQHRPRRQTVPAGRQAAARLTCRLGLLDPAREGVQWQRRGVALPAAHSAELSVGSATGVSPMDAGLYQCCSRVWPSLCDSVALEVVGESGMKCLLYFDHRSLQYPVIQSTAINPTNFKVSKL